MDKKKSIFTSKFKIFNNTYKLNDLFSAGKSRVISVLMMLSIIFMIIGIILVNFSGVISINTSDLQALAEEMPSIQSLMGGSGTSGTSLIANVSAACTYTQNYDWSIDKSVSPDTWNIFRGDTATSQYTISVTKTTGTSHFYVSGIVEVYNNGAVPTENLAITIAIISQNGKITYAQYPLTLDPSQLQPGQTAYYNYNVPLTGVLTPGDSYKVEARITITNHSGSLGTPFGPEPKASFTVPATPTQVNGQVNVDDTNGGTWLFTNSGSVTYTKTFNTAGTFPNTATIRETGQSDSASVTVAVYDIAVTKTAVPSYTKTYDWQVEKSVSPENWDLFVGDAANSQYTIDLTRTEENSNYKVTGTITITNPAPMPVTVSIKDMLGATAATVKDGGSAVTSVTVPSSGSKSLTYEMDLTDATNGMNVATAGLQNYAYEYGKDPVALGVRDISGNAAVDFANAQINYVNPEVTVEDDLEGDLGTYSEPATITYTDKFTATDTGNTIVKNTVEVKHDGHVFDSDSATVAYNVFDITVEKTAEASYTRTFGWTIDKAVTPALWDIFKGDTATSQYKVSVTKDDGTDGDWEVTGTIKITNNAPMAATVNIADAMESYNAIVYDDVTPVTSVTVPATGSKTLTYAMYPLDGNGGTNTATATLQNYEYSPVLVATPKGTTQFTGDASVQYSSPTLVNNAINVDDTYGGSWEFNDDGFVTYTKDFSEAGTYENIATIRETGQYDDAHVVVNVYELTVEKTAVPSFTRTYGWEIHKTVTPEVWNLFTGDSGTSDYTVTVVKDQGIDSNYKVTGIITITNPAPMDAIVNIADAMGDIDAIVKYNDAIVTSVTVPHNGYITLSYEMSPMDGFGGTNVATATLPNYAYEYGGGKSALGSSTDFTGSTGVTFGEPTELVYNEINVEDSNGGLWKFSSSGSVTYPDTFTTEGTFINTATILETGQSDSASVTVNVYDIEVTKDADTSFTRTYGWTIDKSVTPDTWNLFRGDSGTSEYTISVKKDDGIDSDFKVSGTITIKNPAPIDAIITDVSDVYDGKHANVYGVTVPYILVAGGTLECTYEVDADDNTGGTNTATATLQNYDYVPNGQTASGTKDYTGTANVVFDSGSEINEVYDSVFVSDTNGLTWSFDDDDSKTYTMTFDVTDEGINSNIATIVDTGQFDSASVTVNVFDLTVEKTAFTTYTKTYDWDIEKSVTPETWNIFEGDTATSLYTVSVTKGTGVDSDWAVNGQITITNTAPIPAVIYSISDVYEDNPGIVYCPVSLPYKLDPGASIVCSYNVIADDGSGDVNTATATLQNYDYDKNMQATEAGTTDYSGSANAIFSQPTTIVNDEIHVVDTFGKSWTFSDSGQEAYERTFTDAGTYHNTATIQETGDSDSASVTVTEYGLDVMKTADTSYTKTYNWDVSKTVTPEHRDMFTNDEAICKYTITVTKDIGVIDGWAVNGEIVVSNDAPIDAVINSVSDLIDTTPVIIVGPTFPCSIPAGGSALWTYSTSLPNGDTKTNVATAELQNYARSYAGSPVELSTTQSYSGSEEVDFSDADETLVHDSVIVKDTNGGEWPLSDSKTWDYTVEYSYGTAGNYEEDNTVTMEDALTHDILGSDKATVTFDVYDLSVSKTADTSYTKTYGWDVTKTVTLADWDLFVGEKATSKYTVSATRDDGTNSDWAVTGEITITNPSNMAVNVDVSDALGVANAVIYDGVTMVTSPVTVPACSSKVLTYTIEPGSALDGTNVATVKLQNVEYGWNANVVPLSTFNEYTGNAPVSFSDADITTVHGSVTVTDTNGDTWYATDDASWDYFKQFTYTEADSYSVDNTVILTDTNTGDELDKASATVTIDVYDPCIFNDPVATYDRTYHWTIDKSADKTEEWLKTGEFIVANYIVKVDATYDDSNYALDGFLEITNPSPKSMTLNSFSCIISPDIVAIVDPGTITFPYVLEPGENIKIDYSAIVPDKSTRVSTCTVVQQLYSYDYLGNPTPDGTRTFTSVSDPVDFANALINEIDESIIVTDSLQGYLGTATFGIDTLPKEFKYSRQIGPYDAVGDYTIHNVAEFTTCDTGTKGSDHRDIIIHVTDTASVEGYKFYDTNCNGIKDAGEPWLAGWKINLNGVTSSGTLYNMDIYTDASGYYLFDELEAGEYKVSEVFPASPMYVATTPDSYTFTLGVGEHKIIDYFGNVALTPGNGGGTIGFWGNKNGQKLIDSEDITYLNTLNLYTPLGYAYPPFTSKDQIRVYLRNANSFNAKYMLSAQLIATVLNVRNAPERGYSLSGSTIIYVGESSYVPTGFITVNEVINNANNALLTDDRVTQLYWKDICDGINNNMYMFVSPVPITPVYI